MHWLKIFVTILLLAIMHPGFAQASKVGTAAPDFTLEDLNGKSTTLQQFKGKVVLLDFWAPWCDPCRDGLPLLDALYRKYSTNGLVVM